VTPTSVPGGGPAAEIPALDPVALTLLGLALAGVGWALTRRR
jgi:IPTL-CTERM motif